MFSSRICIAFLLIQAVFPISTHVESRKACTLKGVQAKKKVVQSKRSNIVKSNTMSSMDKLIPSKSLFKLKAVDMLFFLRWSKDTREVRFAGSGCVFYQPKQCKWEETDKLAGTQGHTCSK